MKNQSERERSLPWGEDELLYCNGFNLTYSCREGEIQDVHLPGRRAVNLLDFTSWAEREGHQIVLPARVRDGRSRRRAA